MSQPIPQPPDDWIVNPDATDKPPVAPAPKSLRVGFTVGIVEGSEELVFRIHGTAPGAMELRGLVEYARMLIEQSMSGIVPNPEHQKLQNQIKELEDKVRKATGV